VVPLGPDFALQTSCNHLWQSVYMWSLTKYVKPSRIGSGSQTVRALAPAIDAGWYYREYSSQTNPSREFRETSHSTASLALLNTWSAKLPVPKTSAI
jgi:hypothetical protein